MSFTLPTKNWGQINFGSIFCAPGARGFYGEGYPFHRFLRYAGLTWNGTSFAGKTVTVEPKAGNMLLEKDGVTPQEFIPQCIVVKPSSGHVLNAVGLSNRGVKFYMEQGGWKKFTQPFCLSFMAVSQTKEERLDEARTFVDVTRRFFRGLRTLVALQINGACPNAGVRHENIGLEIMDTLDILAALEIPLILNFNPLVPIELLEKVSEHPACNALWIANTIPWGSAGINWVDIFGVASESPLIKRGFHQAGGLSGPACLPFTVEKVLLARHRNITLPIIAGNGIQCVDDVIRLKSVGADAIAIGCVALVRPWRMKSIVKAANQHLLHTSP